MPASCHRHASGFTLLEVLIALFVLGFGLLALAALQIRTYSATRDAEYQSIAALHAEGLAEAMRANPKRTGVTNEPWSWQHYLTGETGVVGATTKACTTYDDAAQGFSSGSVECTQDEIAAHDLALFKARLESAFPGADEVKAGVCPSADLSAPPTLGSLGCDASGPLAIKIAWRVKVGSDTNQKLSASSGTTSSLREMGFQMRFSP
ncbi:type IV pilus modification protein PilV [Crenobacter luteus]|uniref:Type IV pilus modification protein PilV n=1 Tax=Crenobacter luteus TaxID=1452487 RepID=A0A161SI98_9NEIS|nr:type IV pilus modification protein PilV [Crenobacter luteus]KZE33580.1 hypothetical protein AVW16_08575 [Crenobacter luteus]TCP12983.1 type IV pilus modification protein PilV [Crenobacter luteus]